MKERIVEVRQKGITIQPQRTTRWVNLRHMCELGYVDKVKINKYVTYKHAGKLTLIISTLYCNCKR